MFYWVHCEHRVPVLLSSAKATCSSESTRRHPCHHFPNEINQENPGIRCLKIKGFPCHQILGPRVDTIVLNGWGLKPSWFCLSFEQAVEAAKKANNPKTWQEATFPRWFHPLLGCENGGHHWGHGTPQKLPTFFLGGENDGKTNGMNWTMFRQSHFLL